jgi:hypothetical protein
MEAPEDEPDEEREDERAGRAWDSIRLAVKRTSIRSLLRRLRALPAAPPPSPLVALRDTECDKDENDENGEDAQSGEWSGSGARRQRSRRVSPVVLTAECITDSGRAPAFAVLGETQMASPLSSSVRPLPTALSSTSALTLPNSHSGSRSRCFSARSLSSRCRFLPSLRPTACSCVPSLCESG